ncbi:hypothetical protein [Verrucomicrobium sp. GAS474]|uniref:hypothetical protein n=1 Tax=Verrucomicrobium sp. GAS474 TaxID=1882831 RepID=UPI0012FF9D9B|nr:hypothetical protein [Verrucomicrobium sp. GAS474]
MSTPTDIHAVLLESAKQYQHSVTPQAVLEPYKEAILLLRAKYASYEKITETLTAHGVQVSGATVRKFCRRYHAEMRRLRTALDVERRAAVAAQKPSPDAPPSPERPPLTSEIGKRGPRIARDEL